MAVYETSGACDLPAFTMAVFDSMEPKNSCVSGTLASLQTVRKIKTYKDTVNCPGFLLNRLNLPKKQHMNLCWNLPASI